MFFTRPSSFFLTLANTIRKKLCEEIIALATLPDACQHNQTRLCEESIALATGDALTVTSALGAMSYNDATQMLLGMRSVVYLNDKNLNKDTELQGFPS